MQRITGLPDDQVVAWEEKLEAQVVASLQAVMDKIAARIERIMVAAVTTGPTGDDDPPPLTGELAIPDPVPSPASIPSTPNLPPGQPYISPDDLASITPLWQQQVADQVLPLVAQVFIDSVGHVRSQILDAVAPGVLLQVPGLGSVAAEQYLAQARNTYQQVGDHLWATARAQLSQGFEAGESIPQLAARLRQSAGLSARTSVMVARTSVIEASNAGSMSMARASGYEMLKTWLATNDRRTRPAHLEAEARYEADPIPLNQPFIVGGYPAQYPAALTLPPAMRYNCRCAIGYVMPDKPKAITPADPDLDQLPGTSGVPGDLSELSDREFIEATYRELGGQYMPQGGDLSGLRAVVDEKGARVLPKTAAPGDGAAVAGEVLAAPTKVRSSLLRASTPQELRQAWQAEMRTVTGRDIIVNLPPDASVLTMREHAEGVLQMLERFPEARLRKISWFDGADSANYAHVRRGSASIEFNSRFASEAGRRAYLASLRSDVKGWDASTGPGVGWSVRGARLPQATSYHEFAHVLSIETMGGAKLGDRALTLAHRRAALEGVDADTLVARDVSAYAGTDGEELIGEAMADVMVNGPRASVLSREIYDLVEAEYRARGLAVRTATVDDLIDEGAFADTDLFPKAAGPKPTASLTVAQLRALAKERGITVPPGTRKADLVRMVEQRADVAPAPGAPRMSTEVQTSLSAQDQARVRTLVRRDPQIYATVQDRYGSVSTSGNLSDADAAWLQEVYERERPFVERVAQEAQIKRALDVEAKKLGMTPADYRTREAAKLKEVLDGKPVAIRVRDEAGLQDILSSGRFKTSLEGVKRGRGLTVAKDRRRLGETVMGVPADISIAERPVYGYVGIRGIEPALSPGRKIAGIAQMEGQEDILSVYGQVTVALKPGVRARTTVTVGDSLDELAFVRPSPIDAPSADSLGIRGLEAIDRPGFTRHGYVEAQIQGGLRREDIAEVFFADEPAAATVAALRESGIPWRVLRRTDEPVFPVAAAAAGGVPASSVAPSASRLATMKVGELRDLARARGIDVPVKARKADLVKALEAPGPGPGIPDLADAARVRQVVIDERRAVADSLAEVRELLANGASDRALTARAGLISRRTTGVAGEDLGDVVRAMESGDADRIRTAVGDVAARRGLTAIDAPAGQDWVPFDPKLHEVLPGEIRPPAGTFVHVGRPGYSVRLDDGEVVHLAKAKVERLTPAELDKIRGEAVKQSAARALTGEDALRAVPIRDDAALEGLTTRLEDSGIGYSVEVDVDLGGIPGGKIRDGLADYSDNGYQYVNAALRVAKGDLDKIPAALPEGTRGIMPGFYSERRVLDQARAIDAIMARSEITHEIRVFRGIDQALPEWADPERSLVGQVWRDDAYVSTSAREASTTKFAGNGAGIRMRIRVPRGTRAVGVENSQRGLKIEQEILLDRGLTYQVTADRMVHGVRTLDVEIVERKAVREAARERNRTIEAQRGTARLLAEVDELAAKGATKTVIRERLDPALREAGQAYAGADAAAVDLVLAALDSGDLVKVRAAVTRASTKAKVKPIGRAGQKTTFDPATMEGVGGIDIAPGAKVTVVRRGSTIEGLSDPLARAQVTSIRGTSTVKTVTKGDFTGLTRVGEQMGSNPGALYEAADGSRWYIKTASNPAQLRSEKLALDLYREAGLDVPDVVVGRGVEGLGETQIASRIVEGAVSDLRQRLAENAYRRQLQEGFATDAWLGNWDVLGLGMDNVLTTAAGVPIRIEAGGALRFRARGATKAFGDEAGEFDTMREAGRGAGAAFADMTPEQLIASAERIRKITPAKIKALVKRNDLDPDLADTLIARREDILRRADALAGPKPLTPQQYAARLKAAAKGQDALDASPLGRRATGESERREVWSGVEDARVRTAIREYQEFGYEDVNFALRAGPEEKAFTSGRQWVPELDRALDGSRLTDDVVLWRSPGSGQSIFGDHADWGDSLAGFEWLDPAYSSTSASKEIADHFMKDGGVRLRILAAQGSKAIQLSGMPTRAELADWTDEASEAELLLGRSARYRVVRDRGWTDTTHPTTRERMRVRDLDVEVVVPDVTPPLPWETK